VAINVVDKCLVSFWYVKCAMVYNTYSLHKLCLSLLFGYNLKGMGVVAMSGLVPLKYEFQGWSVWKWSYMCIYAYFGLTSICKWSGSL